MGERVYKPRHNRTTGTFSPRKFDPAGDADRKLHESEKWRRFSRKFLAVNKECYVCGLKSEVTDHLEPSKGRKEIFEKNLNFLSLCIRCHNTVTAKFDAKFVPGDSIEPKIS